MYPTRFRRILSSSHYLKFINKKARCISGLSSGDDGIRTHVPGNSDKLISSQSRYGLFGTSPYIIDVLFPERLLLYYITVIFSNIFYHKI